MGMDYVKSVREHARTSTLLKAHKCHILQYHAIGLILKYYFLGADTGRNLGLLEP